MDRVTLIPGVNTMASRALNRGGVSDANLVRWRSGMPEKMRGWQRWASTLIQGVARTLLPFASLAGDRMLGIGTHDHFYVARGNAPTDVTPVDRTAAITSIATTAASAVMTVTTPANHNLQVGDWITFDTLSGTSRTPSGVTVGGVVITGDYRVTGTPSGTTCTIRAAANASSTASGGGSATMTCYLPAGQQHAIGGLGFGAGGFGMGPYGGPATVAANLLPARIVSMDNWGQGILAVPTQERLYVWFPDASGGITTRFAVVTNGTPANGPPQRINMVLVGTPERHVLLLGCSDLNATTNYDPMLLRWGDVEDYTLYRATSTNSAGSIRLQGGTKLVGGRNSNLVTLVWSDQCLFAVRFIGLPYVYSVQRIGVNCGLIAQNAHAELDGAVFWWGLGNFWTYQGGAPRILECTMLEEVLGRLTQSQASKIVAGVNATEGEVWWFYPADGSMEPSRYIVWNVGEKCWYGGALARGAYNGDQIFDTPLAVDAAGQIWAHEIGMDADGSELGDYITTGFWDMGDGEQIIFASQIIPDFMGSNGGAFTGQIELSFLVTDYPMKAPRTRGPYVLTPSTTSRAFRARGRQIAMKWRSVGTGADWRLGAVRVNTTPDGTR